MIQKRQAAMNEIYGTKVGTDRSRYKWDEAGNFTKHEILHLIAKRFVGQHEITSRQEFDEKFGGVITGIHSTQLANKNFNPSRLLTVIAANPKDADRDLKLVAEHGAITFDGVDYRTAWGVGFANFPDMGRVAQLPVIEHFRGQPGYDIEPV